MKSTLSHATHDLFCSFFAFDIVAKLVICQGGIIALFLLFNIRMYRTWYLWIFFFCNWWNCDHDPEVDGLIRLRDEVIDVRRVIGWSSIWGYIQRASKNLCFVIVPSLLVHRGLAMSFFCASCDIYRWLWLIICLQLIDRNCKWFRNFFSCGELGQLVEGGRVSREVSFIDWRSKLIDSVTLQVAGVQTFITHLWRTRSQGGGFFTFQVFTKPSVA